MTHLILTVGTGTAGKHSNLAAGLRRTLEIIRPDKFWLIPSTDEISQLTADLVREGLPGFQAWTEENQIPYCAISRPDSLEDCRQTVRGVILRARESLPAGARLLVNPTSGTKQMSVGAALAALDESVGELIFTVGQRADGVVMTGTEALETFDASVYFAERDRETALLLARAGAFSAAASVASRHSVLTDLEDTGRCLHEWRRQNYAEARRLAARSQAKALAPVRHALEQLAKAMQKPEPQPVIIADMLHTAELLHLQGEHESALVLSCRVLEMGLRHALFQKTGLHEPYELGKICALPISAGIKDRCRSISTNGQRTVLDLKAVAGMLMDLGHDLGAAFFSDRDLRGLVRVRNDLMHQLRAVTPAESQDAVWKVKNLLTPLNLPPPVRRPAL